MLLPVVIGLLWLGGYWFGALVALAAVLMVLEWETLTQETGLDVRGWARCMAIVLGLIVLLAVSLPPVLWLTIFAVAVVFALVSGVLVERAMLWRCLGLLWIGLPCAALVWLRDQPGAGLVGVLWLLVCIWACDTGAYIAGKNLGGPKLAPKVSPAKTWSGLLGGMAAAATASLVFSFFEYTGPILLLVVAGTVLAAVSQLGDLAESAVKRHFDVKDSGQLIPGHGGLLDRVDGLLFAIPVGAVMMMVMNQGTVWAWR